MTAPGVVNHVGTRLLADLADQVGLTDALSVAMAPTKQRRRGHDRGGLVVDVAVMLADGGDTISDVAVLRDQPDLFGDVASHPTVWRTLEAVNEAVLERIKAARAEARSRAWAAGADPGFYVAADLHVGHDGVVTGALDSEIDGDLVAAERVVPIGATAGGVSSSPRLRGVR